MGQFAFLINKKEKIYTEAYQITASGSEINNIQNPNDLAWFLEYCRKKELQVEVVSEHWFLESKENENCEYNAIDHMQNIMKKELLIDFIDWYSKNRSSYEIPEKEDIDEYLKTKADIALCSADLQR